METPASQGPVAEAAKARGAAGRPLLLFALADSRPLGESIALALGTTLAEHEERRFSDGEQKTRPLVDPAGCDAYVVHALHGGPRDSGHDKLMQLLLLIATLREHGAARVTAVVPYLAYARKDRRTKPFDPVTVRYVAQLFEAVGTDALIVLEPHNVAALENAFRIRSIVLEAHRVFTPQARALAGDGPLVVASPDPGGVKRAQLWREALEASLGEDVGFAFLDKRRSGDVLSGGDLLAGRVDGAVVLLYDDLISTGSTMVRAAARLCEAGARRVIGCAAHGLFVENAAEVLDSPHIERVVVTDSVPPFRIEGTPLRRSVEVLACGPLLAEAIDAHHRAG